MLTDALFKVDQENRRRFWDPYVRYKTLSMQMA